MTSTYLGIDVGSVTTKAVAVDADTGAMLESLYIRTCGDPVGSIRDALARIREALPGIRVLGAGTTGSGRTLAAKLVGAGLIKNEITAHTAAATAIQPEVRTILEIGGQDAKIIIVQDGIAVDFAMNSVCAAGTGSFLDQQAGRLGISVEEMGRIALTSDSPAAISGRCTVFAETDMIHKQQIGIPRPDIIAGLCASLVRNYLGTVARGKPLEAPVVFQGGVAANPAIVQEFRRQTGLDVEVSPHYGVTGALGVALLARRAGPGESFTGFQILEREYRIDTFVCGSCEEACTVLTLHSEGKPPTHWNDRCGKYSGKTPAGDAR